jgi:hypothetical protein
MNQRPSDKRSPRPRNARKPVRLDKDAQSAIGRGLRAMYDSIVDQGVPDRFAKLVARIETADTGHTPPEDEAGPGDA